MKIAIIDDGVNSSYYPNIGELCFNLRVNEHNKIVKRIRYDKNAPSHGTTCAAIIKKYAPNSQIGSIKVISDNTMRGKANHLITALEWCAENNIRLVHMSIGSREVKDIVPIREAVTKLLNKGCIIVAALANTMKFSVPACIDGVFGVKTSNILEDAQFYVDEGGLYDVPFIASSKHTLFDYMGKQHITPQCNSFSAPLITAQIHNLIETKPTITQLHIRNAFGLNAKRTYHELLTKTPLTAQDIDIPIICVIGERNKVLSVVPQLNQLFLNTGYPCKAFYDGDQERSIDVDWIPPNVPVKNLCAFHTNRLGLSLILLATENVELINTLADARVYISPNIKRNRYNGDDTTIPQNYTVDQLKRAVKYIEKIGSKG